MKTEACGATHTGNIRKNNEDNLYVDGIFRSDLKQSNMLIRSRRNDGPYVYAVFDGLGGEECGEQASLVAAMGLMAMERNGTVRDISTFVTTANRAVIHEAQVKDARRMGTTAVIAIIDDGKAYIYNVGDSRAYLFRDGSLKQISKDHSVLQSLMDNGFTAEAERQKDKYAGELTQYLGMVSEEDIEPEAYAAEEDLLEGDVLLLCSDGLSGELSDEEICAIIAEDSEKGADFTAAHLIKSALNKAGRDNTTALVCKIK